MPDKTSRTQTLLGLGLSALAALSFGYGALAPLPAMPGPPGSDKIAHMLAFAAIALPTAFLARAHLLWFLPVALAYGGGVEIIQPYVGRGRELLDFVFDALGLVVGTGAGLMLARLLTRRP